MQTNPRHAEDGKPGYVRLIVILGLLSCVGPFSIDMYLPALPEVARDLRATPAAAQYSISALFLKPVAAAA